MRIIKLVVIVMGVVIVVGTGLLFWRIYHLGSAPRATPAPAAVSAGTPAAPDRLSLGLPAGCDISDTDAADGRLYVRTSCGEVHVLEARSLRILSVIGR